MTDDLIAWLTQQIDEDERIAKASGGQIWVSITDTPWVITAKPETWMPPGSEHFVARVDQSMADRSRSAHFDPARALREVAAKRAIIEAAEEANGLDAQVDGELRVGARDVAAEPYVGDVILRALASVYADRPGYRDEWRLT